MLNAKLWELPLTSRALSLNDRWLPWMSISRSSVERHERLADDESRNWHALDDASGTRLHFLRLAFD